MDTTAVTSAEPMPGHRAEPLMLLRRIGSTNFIVSVHFSDTETETMEDKILRMIEREVEKSA